MSAATSRLTSYLRGVETQLTEGFEDEEHHELFLNNVFEEVAKDLAIIAVHPKLSFIVQKLIRKASATHVETLLRSLLPSLDALSVDRCSTHVIESLLHRATYFFNADEENPVMKLVHLMGMKMLERTDLVTDANGNFVLRAVIEVTSGVRRHIGQSTGREVPMKEHEFYDEFSGLLRAFAGYLLPTSPASFKLIEKENTSVLAQILLNAFRKRDPKMCSELCQSIISSGFFDQSDSDNSPAAFTSKAGAYYCGILVKAVDSDSLGQLINKVVVPHFDSLVTHPYANHVLQDLIQAVQTEEQIMVINELMEGRMFSFLEKKRAGIILHLINNVSQYPSLQEKVMKNWEAEIESKDTNFIIAIAQQTATPDLSDAGINSTLRNMSYLPSRVIQALFTLQQHTRVCKSLQVFNAEQLVNLAYGKYGSYILESMLASPFIDRKYKLDFISSLRSYYVTMITDPAASKVFEAFWQFMNVSYKKQIMEDLAKSVAPIMGSLSGKHVAVKIHLKDYIHSRPEWDSWLIKDNRVIKDSQGRLKPGKKNKGNKTGEAPTGNRSEQTEPSFSPAKASPMETQEGKLKSKSVNSGIDAGAVTAKKKRKISTGNTGVEGTPGFGKKKKASKKNTDVEDIPVVNKKKVSNEHTGVEGTPGFGKKKKASKKNTDVEDIPVVNKKKVSNGHTGVEGTPGLVKKKKAPKEITGDKDTSRQVKKKTPKKMDVTTPLVKKKKAAA